jgi:hypothetical protein
MLPNAYRGLPLRCIARQTPLESQIKIFSTSSSEIIRPPIKKLHRPGALVIGDVLRGLKGSFI